MADQLTLERRGSPRAEPIPRGLGGMFAKRELEAGERHAPPPQKAAGTDR
jgi:hypothetical protein